MKIGKLGTNEMGRALADAPDAPVVVFTSPYVTVVVEYPSWCDQCQQYGHRKWLFLGTHRTHRLYLRWKMRKVTRDSRRASAFKRRS